MSPSRMPAIFLPHGGGPWPFVDLGIDPRERKALADFLTSLHKLPPAPPKALLVISAHWEENIPTVMTSADPPLFYDYYGFPPEAYALTWPAQGAPHIATRVQELLAAAGIRTQQDATRGFDHGTFVPLKLMYPKAEIPTLQLSLKVGLDPSEHLAMGRALAPLRDEGVVIIGSGMTFHNLRSLRDARALQWSELFDAWLCETMDLPPDLRAERLLQWETAPAAREAHPREEHLLPLMVVTGAAKEDRTQLAYHDTMFGWRLSAFIA